jgi:hypothetical protein
MYNVGDIYYFDDVDNVFIKILEINKFNRGYKIQIIPSGNHIGHIIEKFYLLSLCEKLYC